MELNEEEESEKEQSAAKKVRTEDEKEQNLPEETVQQVSLTNEEENRCRIYSAVLKRGV